MTEIRQQLPFLSHLFVQVICFSILKEPQDIQRQHCGIQGFELLLFSDRTKTVNFPGYFM